jgi:transposase-like protein
VNKKVTISKTMKPPKPHLTHDQWMSGVSGSSPIINGFADEEAAIKWFREVMWEGGVPMCHHCGSYHSCNVGAARRMLHKCYSCGRVYSLRYGTIFQDSHLPLTTWFKAIRYYYEHLRWNVLDVARTIRVSHRTAIRMVGVLKNAGFSFSSPVTGRITRVRY